MILQILYHIREKKPEATASDSQTVEKASQNFFAKAKKQNQIIFGRGVYVDKNTSQAASVRVVRFKRTRSARSGLQKTGGKARRDFSTS